jgi:hypothetical protein
MDVVPVDDDEKILISTKRGDGETTGEFGSGPIFVSEI